MDIAPAGNTGQAAAAVSGNASPAWLAQNSDLIRSVTGINASDLFGEGSELTFAVDRDTKQPVVRIVDSATGEVLWQAPPEYILQLAQTLAPQSADTTRRASPDE